jgi:hypothetical protein
MPTEARIEGELPYVAAVVLWLVGVVVIVARKMRA